MTMMTEQVERRVFAVCHTPHGRIHPLGLLTRHESSPPDEQVGYRFVYVKEAESLEDWHRLPGLPDLHRVYESEHLFSTFQGRQMSRRRPDYPQYLRKLNLDLSTDPFDVMARSEGKRVTDPFGVFAPPEQTTDGDLTTLFFCKGIRNWPPEEDTRDVVRRVRPGDLLALRDQPDAPDGTRAVLVNPRTGEELGWVPSYLADMIDELREFFATEVEITAEHVNSPDNTGPYHLLLCRLRAPWPEGYKPLSGPEYQPIVSV